MKAQRAFSEENYKYEAEHDRLLKAVLEEGIKYHNAYRAPIAVVNAIKAIAFVGSFSNPLSLTAGAYAVGKVLNTLDISNEDMYGWMIKVDGEGEYLNMDDYWYDAKRGERVQLTDAQRAYRDFYARSLQKV